MKKSFTALLAASLMLAGCASSAGSTATASSKTFTGSSTGMQGPVTVTLSVDGDKITNVELTEISETPSVASVAMERIPQQIVEHQTTTLDTVTGATFASNAIMRAASEAAKAAGLDMDKLEANAYHAEAGEDEVWDTDLLVVGAGGAGFSAATTAAQEGAEVIMIEKSSVAGGNTLMQGGAFNANDDDAQAETILTEAQKTTLDGYLALKPSDKKLHFDAFPEWKEVLADLQADIKKFYAENEGKTVGKDMPGYDSVELHMWHIYTGGLRQMYDGKWVASDIDLARTLAENALGTYEWCVDSLNVEGQYGKGAGESLFTVLGAMWPRTHKFMTSTPLIDTLTKAAEKEGVKLYTEVAAKSLITDENGKVVGANCEKADGTKVTVNTKKGVILTSGGYGAYPKMVKEYDNYWGDDLTDHTLTTNVGTNTGDGIVMAQEIGAGTVGLDVVQLMPSSSPIKGTMTDGIWGDASQQIWIDGEGNRFVNEYAERDVLAKASLALDNGIFYIIYAGKDVNENGELQGATLEDGLFGTTVQSMVDNGHVWYGSTLKELAENSKTSAGGAAPAFSEEALRATIEKYNTYVANQKDDDFGKEVLAGAIDIDAIENNPDAGFVISPRKASIHHTMGGVQINTNAEVLDESGNAIDGLWAAGEVTGGIHGGNRLGGNAVADIFTFGHIAGASAAQ